MHRYLASIIIGFIAHLAPAQTLGPAEQSLLSRLIFSTCIDIHDNIGCETLALLGSETDPSMADLVIMPDFRDSETSGPLLVARNVVFSGSLWGMAPWIEDRESEGFLLNSEQIGAGRQPWTQTLTVVWRNGAFVVAGYTFSSYDRILNNTYSCDINLLTGSFESEVMLFDMETEEETTTRSADRGTPINIRLTDWATNWREPDACDAEADIYYRQ